MNDQFKDLDPREAAYESVACGYYSARLCNSCDLLGITPGNRLQTKLSRILSDLNANAIVPETLAPMVLPLHPWESRRKIKMAVTGSYGDPRLGIVRADLSSQDLLECPLTPEPIRELLRFARTLIQENQLHPYDIKNQLGELKHLIVMTNSELSQIALRFVLKSTTLLEPIRALIPALMSRFSALKVISCNIQPKHAAILEGPEEVYLTSETRITEYFGDIPLDFTPQSFMQVTPEIAAKLYTRAAHFTVERQAKIVLDLFCGVGGFSLHVARSAGSVTGVEVSPSAISAARLSATSIGLKNTTFFAADVESFIRTHNNIKPDLIIVNPPRRGLSETILRHILDLAPASILYSSCNPITFARDAKELLSNYSLVRITPFDMFPMTSHCEVLGEFVGLSA
jgi:23S rRNA (uracil747-C5)-methyltransferase